MTATQNAMRHDVVAYSPYIPGPPQSYFYVYIFTYVVTLQFPLINAFAITNKMLFRIFFSYHLE